MGPDASAEDPIGSEFELIAALRERLGIDPSARSPLAAEIATGSGDDAAVTVPAGATATSVDLAVEGVHFRRLTASPEAIGHKAMAAALSDLAAMGAAPGEGYVQLGIPDDFGDADCLALADGVAGLCREHGVAVLGGDVSAAPVLLVAISVVGHAPSADALVLRDGASDGEELFVTGELGGAAAGLLLLERPELRGAVSSAVAEALVQRQLRPTPRLAEGLALAGAGARAMIDISDGLVADAAHLALASGVGLELDADALPLAPGVADVAAAVGMDQLVLAAGGGEDYELLVALPAGVAEGLEPRLSRVGRVGSGSEAVLRGRSGERIDAAGFDHLLSRPAGTDPGERA